MAVYLIWLDDNGCEIKREQKGRGRAPSGFSKGEDGNWYGIASALAAAKKAAEEKAVQRKAVQKKAPAKTHFLIWLDKDGNETKREPRTGRGRPPKDFTRRDDGNWYYEPPWRRRARLAAEADTGIEDEEPPEELIPRVRHVKAHKRTTPEAIARVCHVVNHEEHDGVLVLTSPILTGHTGLDELDEMDGQPVFHRIEIDTHAKTVSVWNITSPGGPYLIVEDALAINMGDNDAATARKDG